MTAGLLADVLEPCRNGLVQIRPQRLRHRLVDGLADERVLEAEAVPGTEMSGPIKPAAHELEHAGLCGLALAARYQLKHGVEREAPADDRRPLEHGAHLEDPGGRAGSGGLPGSSRSA